MQANIDLNRIEPNPWQPRKNFPEDSLLELGESIKSEGLKQAIGLRPHPTKSGFFQIIWGERRVRASRLVELITIRADIMKANDLEMKKWAVLENRSREDTNPLEDAKSTKMLMSAGMTLKQIAKSVGRSPASLEKELALLRLPEELQAEVAKKSIPKNLGIAIGQLPLHMHMEAFRVTQGKVLSAQMDIINALEMKSKNIVLFELTAEERKEVQDLKKKWDRFKKMGTDLLGKNLNVMVEVATTLEDIYFLKIMAEGLTKLRDQVSKKKQIKKYG